MLFLDFLSPLSTSFLFSNYIDSYAICISWCKLYRLYCMNLFFKSLLKIKYICKIAWNQGIYSSCKKLSYVIWNSFRIIVCKYFKKAFPGCMGTGVPFIHVKPCTDISNVGNVNCCKSNPTRCFHILKSHHHIFATDTQLLQVKSYAHVPATFIIIQIPSSPIFMLNQLDAMWVANTIVQSPFRGRTLIDLS